MHSAKTKKYKLKQPNPIKVNMQMFNLIISTGGYSTLLTLFINFMWTKGLPFN